MNCAVRIKIDRLSYDMREGGGFLRGRRVIAVYLLSVLLLFSLSSCGRGETTPREVYEAFAEKYPLPPHLTFDSEAGQNDPAYLSDKDFNLLFSRADGSDDREDIAAFVLCLGASGRTFYECGFFRCVDLSGAREVEGLCLSRCETVRRMRAEVDVSCAEDPVVLRFGAWVFYFALPDNDLAEDVLRRVI